MTINKLSRVTGIDGGRLISIESGTAEPRREEVEAIARALRVMPHLLDPLSAST